MWHLLFCVTYVEIEQNKHAWSRKNVFIVHSFTRLTGNDKNGWLQPQTICRIVDRMHPDRFYASSLSVCFRVLLEMMRKS